MANTTQLQKAISRLPLIGKPFSTATCPIHGNNSKANREGKCCVCTIEGVKEQYRLRNSQLTFNFGEQ